MSNELPPVWPWHEGSTRGVALEPLYNLKIWMKERVPTDTMRMQSGRRRHSTSWRYLKEETALRSMFALWYNGQS